MFNFPVVPELGPLVVGSLSGISVVGFILNVFLLFIMSRVSKQNTLSFQLIKAIAGMDLINSVNYIFWLGLRGVKGPEILHDMWVCRGFYSTWSYMSIMSHSLLCLLAIERAFVLSRGRGLSRRICWSIMIVFGLIVFALLMGNFTTKEILIDPTVSYCRPDKSKWSSIVMAIARLALMIPLPVIIVCYIKIMLATQHLSSARKSLIWSRSILFLVMYSICFIPSMILYSWDVLFERQVPGLLFAFYNISVGTIIAFNPALVLALQYSLLKEARQVLRISKNGTGHSKIISITV